MKPRGLENSLKVDGEKYNISVRGSDKEVPNKIKFNSAEIVTYCPYCDSKYKLQYSGYFPKQIEYNCSNCDKIISVLNLNTKSNVRPSLSKIESSLKKQSKLRESYVIGHNYAERHSTSDVNDLISDLKKYEFYNVIFMILILISGSIFLLSLVLFNLKIIFLTTISIISMSYINRKLAHKYLIKDPKIDNINIYWTKKALKTKNGEYNYSSSKRSDEKDDKSNTNKKTLSKDTIYE